MKTREMGRILMHLMIAIGVIGVGLGTQLFS